MKPQRVVVRRNQHTVDSHWNYLWLELLLIWTNLVLRCRCAGVHAHAHACMCACDFSMPALTAAAGECYCFKPILRRCPCYSVQFWLMNPCKTFDCYWQNHLELAVKGFSNRDLDFSPSGLEHRLYKTWTSCPWRLPQVWSCCEAQCGGSGHLDSPVKPRS